MKIGILFAATAVACASAVFLSAQSRGPATTTAPSVRLDDFSSPQANLKSWLAALRANNERAYIACGHGSNDLAQRFWEAFARVSTTSRRLAEAARTKFASEPEARALPDSVDFFEQELAGATVEIDGTHARLLKKDSKEVMFLFEKVADNWKIDIYNSFKLDTQEGREAAIGLIDSGHKTMASLDPIIRDIENGTIKTLAEMRRRMAGGRDIPKAPATTRASTAPAGR
jgi:hypothetical protein